MIHSKIDYCNAISFESSSVGIAVLSLVSPMTLDRLYSAHLNCISFINLISTYLLLSSLPLAWRLESNEQVSKINKPRSKASLTSSQLRHTTNIYRGVLLVQSAPRQSLVAEGNWVSVICWGSMPHRGQTAMMKNCGEFWPCYTI